MRGQWPIIIIGILAGLLIVLAILWPAALV